MSTTITSTYSDDMVIYGGIDMVVGPSTVIREFYLTFSQDSKTVGISTKPPKSLGQKVAIKLVVKIPKVLFEKQIITAVIDLPPEQVMSQDVVADLKQAVEMTYGKKIEFVIQPAVSAGSDEHVTCDTGDPE